MRRNRIHHFSRRLQKQFRAKFNLQLANALNFCKMRILSIGKEFKKSGKSKVTTFCSKDIHFIISKLSCSNQCCRYSLEDSLDESVVNSESIHADEEAKKEGEREEGREERTTDRKMVVWLY